MKLKKRLVSATPRWVQVAQLLLGTLAGYNVFVMTNPEMLKIVPDGWEPYMVAGSVLSGLLLQLINKIKGAVVTDLTKGG